MNTKTTFRTLLLTALCLLGISATRATAQTSSPTEAELTKLSELLESKDTRKTVFILNGNLVSTKDVRLALPERINSIRFISKNEVTDILGPLFKGKTGAVLLGVTIPREDGIFEVMPKFRMGDMETFKNWLVRNVEFPSQTPKKGNVVINFVVNPDGRITDYRALDYSSPYFFQAVMEAFERSPNWIPGYQNGKPVRVNFTMPVDFVLN